jgi:uncharacterized OB-fold protein
MWKCEQCGYMFFWSPPNHWGPMCPKCGGHHSVEVLE